MAVPFSTTIIYDGNPGPISGSTPFGFYDADTVYQADGPRTANFVAQRLGYSVMGVELQTGSIYSALEEAVTTFGNEIYLFKIRDNYLSLEGTATSSNLNNTVLSTNLGGIIRIGEDYASEAGVGGYINYYTGSITISAGNQLADLNAWAAVSASFLTGSNDSIEVKRIFYEGTPAMVRYYDPYAGTGLQPLMDTFGFGGMSPGVNFTLMPVFADIQRVQAIEFNDQVRRSAFSFELVNNQLRIFPIPNVDMLLYFHYIKVSERNSPTRNAYSASNLVTNISNVPYQNPSYGQINSPGRQWIRSYTLALCKETLGYIRGKYQTTPIPGAEISLNQSDLLTDARTEKDALIQKLREDLDRTSRTSQLAKRAEEGVSIKSTLNDVPLPIYTG